MARQLGFQAGRQGSSAALNVSPAAIEAGQFLPEIDELQVDEPAASLGTVVLGGIHQPGSKAGFLNLRIDRKQTEVGPLTPEFNVHAASENAAILGDQELSRL